MFVNFARGGEVEVLAPLFDGEEDVLGEFHGGGLDLGLDAGRDLKSTAARWLSIPVD